MLFSLILLILLLAIAYYQATQGLFTAIINTVLTVCCAAAAFGTYEWVAVNLLAKYWKPDYAHPIALAAIFGVSLVVLRLIFDRVIRRDCLLPAMIGRVGGGICGLVTSLIMVGILAICLQMLPFGESVLGFARFTPAVRANPDAQIPAADAGESGLLLIPDRFAAGFAGVVSDGVFSGRQRFSQAHPNLAQEVGWVSTTRRGVSRCAKPGGISIIGQEQLQFVYRLVPGDPQRRTADVYEAITPAGDIVYQMLRIQLQDAARDENRSHLFTLRQFRLVGRLGPEGPRTQLYPIGIQQEDAAQPVNRHIRYKKDHRGDWPVVDEILTPREENNIIEIVFELPKPFEPDFLEYKRGARETVVLTKGDAGRRPRDSGSPPSDPAAPPSTPAPTPPTPPEGGTAAADQPGRGSRRPREGEAASTSGGRVRRIGALAGQSTFSDNLPMELKAYRGSNNVDIKAGKLHNGHLIADVADQAAGTDDPVSKFERPTDQRLLHLNVSALNARSGLGRALSFAVGVVQNYLVEDANGKQYRFIGKYAIADVDGKEVFEVQYFPDQAGSVGGTGKFQRIKEDDLKPEDQFVLLFLIDPGVQIITFRTGSDATRADDLRSANLIAPP